MGPGQTDFVRLVQGAQGTLGVVTWASVRLEVKPMRHQIWFVEDDRIERLIELSYRALKPRLGDEWLILNKKILGSIIGGEEARLSQYILVLGLSGYEILPDQRIAQQENDLKALLREIGLNPRTALPGISAEGMADLLYGRPSTTGYQPFSTDGKYRLFFLTTLDRVDAFISQVNGLAVSRGIPEDQIGVYIQPVRQGRGCHLEFAFDYDPGDEKAFKALIDFSTAAGRELLASGAFFSRPYHPWTDLVYDKCPDTVAALRKTKTMLDPHNIMNRGRLCFKEEN